MVQILIAEYSGFCEGVERAYKIALEQAKNIKPVYMLGNLVHNNQVVEKLKDLGVKNIKSLIEISDASNGVLLISAHGVTSDIYDEAKAKGLEIVDTTCPWVKNAQKIAKEISSKGLKVIIVGDKDHPEVKGLLGWSQGQGIIVQTKDDLDKIPQNIFDNGVGVIAQTTQSQENYESVVLEVMKRSKNVLVHKTICGATQKRQSAAIDLAHKVEVMLVIGDQQSANTKRLTELCTKAGTKTYQIQTLSEFDPNWIKGKQKIGITAGASTPEWIISEVISFLNENS